MAKGAQPIPKKDSKNLHRRQLTPSQKALIGVEAKKALAEEAKKRSLANLKQNHQVESVDSTERANLPARLRPRDEAAEIMGVSARSIQNAERIMKEAPEFVDRIRDCG